MKFKWTLYIKIQMLIVSILLLMYMTVILTLYNYVGVKMTERFDNNVLETTQLLQYNIDQIFTNTNEMLNYLADDIHNHTSSESRILEHLESAKLTHESALNVYIAYEDGEIVLFPEADLGEGFDPRERDWYKIAFGQTNIKWSRPYQDQATKAYVITGSKYVVISDQEGVVAIDIKLDQLDDMIKNLSVSENGVIAILNDQGRFIATNNPLYKDKSLSTFDPSAEQLVNFISGQPMTDKGKYFFRILSESDLRLMVFVPTKDIEGDRRQAQQIMTLVTTLILIFGIIVSRWMILKVITPLLKLKDTLVASSQSTDMILYNGETNDEINTIIKAYNTLVNHVNVQGNEIKRLAFKDDLTGLPNRLQFDKIVRGKIKQCDQLALFYLDIDNFKYINDTYGHAAGDQVLIAVAQGLVGCCQEHHIISRLSGDEFGIAVENYGDQQSLNRLSIAILNLVRKPLFVNQIEFYLTASLGVCRYPEDATNYEELLANADIAMYEAKGINKDNFAIYNNQIRDNFLRDMKIETKLNQAIEDRKIFALYQPIINLTTGAIYGFEALARWKDDELGYVFPDVFIPIAERNLSINLLGMQILEQAIGFGQRLYHHYHEYYEVNVNISVLQLHVDHFVEDVLIVLAKYGFPAKYLNLEITESLTLESDEQVLMKLAYLRKKQVKISIDDFGTGYSSLSHLTDLSVSHIKIDRQLIMKARQSEEVLQLMKGIVEFAHTMGYLVVAEGIEDHEMAQMIKEMKADYGQGYMYAKPVSEEQCMALVDENTKW